MSIKIVKVVRDLALADYAAEMNGTSLHAWVNPTRALMRESEAFTKRLAADLDAATGDELDPQLAAWWSVIFSQGADADERLSAADLEQIYAQDPALWIFITTRYWELVNENLLQTEKKRATR